MKFTFNKKVIVGWVIGIIVPLICVPIVVALLAWAQNFGYGRLWHKMMDDITVASKVLSLSIIPNLAVFYFFLNRERYDLAKGIIIGSACFLPFILYANFS